MNQTPDNPSPSGDRPGPGAAAPAGIGGRPALLGEYELRREIGRGGMGTVYEAWQRSLQRIVAVKVLDRQVSSSQTAVVRFQREAQAAAKLRHPHIVPIFALGEEDGVNYYAMELINGCGLNEIISENRVRQTADTATVDLAETVPLPRAEAVAPSDGGSSASPPTSSGSAATSGSTVVLPPSSSVGTSVEFFRTVAEHMATVADALAYAHAHGVIHRDIKPHNLLMDNENHMWISDFGLARLSEQPGVTITGEMLGSPLYMSPEQISGDPSTVNHRTDIYSLGATMYEWLTLVPPYPGETREQVISKILSSEPLPLRAHNPAIPVALETICLKAVERDPNRRYQTAAELRDDLGRYLANQPIRVKRAGLVARVWKIARRNQAASIATAALAILAVLTWALVSSRGRLVEQTAEIEQGRVDSERLERILDVLKDAPLEVRGAAELGAGVLDAAGSFFADAASPKGADPAAVGAPRGIARRAVREYYEAIAPPDWPAPSGTQANVPGSLRLAIEKWESEPEVSIELIDGYLLKHQGDFQATQMRIALAGRLGRDANMLTDAEEIVGVRPRDPHAYVWRAISLLLLGDSDACLADLDQAGELGADAVWVNILRGLALTQAESPTDAIYAFDDVLDRDSGRIVARLGRASARVLLGDMGGAIADLTEVLDLEPENADCLALRGDHYLETGDFSAAETDYAAAMRFGGRSMSLLARYATALSGQGKARESSPSDATLVPGVQEPEAGKGGPTGDASHGAFDDWLRRRIPDLSDYARNVKSSSLSTLVGSLRR